jgi:hypothetical protein
LKIKLHVHKVGSSNCVVTSSQAQFENAPKRFSRVPRCAEEWIILLANRQLLTPGGVGHHQRRKDPSKSQELLGETGLESWKKDFYSSDTFDVPEESEMLADFVALGELDILVVKSMQLQKGTNKVSAATPTVVVARRVDQALEAPIVAVLLQNPRSRCQKGSISCRVEPIRDLRCSGLPNPYWPLN